ncbi:mycothiol synthase [Thermobifida cellulosilytica]|uniref:Mycothiol acetyltransferase n=1 Tax=Thermobifida cellulosilytica TB100 TaxID=665004 RepID=A0A147KL08_THECS|nr:mycothiol synthase [Thermobifida cellulosilytica]KUP98015.1 mycothiol acetyltransferase [Thermobifida cellulosilytica TB100]
MSHILTTDTLDSAQASAVLALAEAVREADGVAALSEQTLLRVRHGALGRARFHLAYVEGDRGTELGGFAFAELSPAEPDAAELAVAPSWRRRGLGRRLLDDLFANASARGLRVWAHGDLAAARALAASAGLERMRGLWKMRLPLRAAEGAAVPDLPEPRLSPEAAGKLEIRTFRVGSDEQEWLRVNALAFADHPEQGAITLEDLRQRQQEEWFDPTGFFVAADPRDGRIAGYHWTKVHADGAGLTDGEPVGEVYVVGVDPAWQGSGLGRALTLVGLRHLRDRGLPWVLLYVDEDNRPAVWLYRSLGFELWESDVMYGHTTR